MLHCPWQTFLLISTARRHLSHFLDPFLTNIFTQHWSPFPLYWASWKSLLQLRWVRYDQNVLSHTRTMASSQAEVRSSSYGYHYMIHPNTWNVKILSDKAHATRIVHFASMDSIFRELQNFSLHRTKCQLLYPGVKVTRQQFTLQLLNSGTIYEEQRNTLNKVIAHFSFIFFSPCQLYDSLSCVKKSTEFLRLYWEDPTP